MLSPVEIATWIALCIPWAEPRLATALVVAGSNGRPFLLATDTGEGRDFSYSSALKTLRDPTQIGQAKFVGLTQIPVKGLTEANLSADWVLDKCTNLQVGYDLFLTAFERAGKVEKSPWKRFSVAFNLYQSNQAILESDYSKRAVDYLMKQQPAAPAPMTSPVYHAVMAEWSAGLAHRHANRPPIEMPSLIGESTRIAAWARSKS